MDDKRIVDSDGNEAKVDATTEALKVQAQAGDAEIGKVKVTDGTLVLDIVQEGESAVVDLKGLVQLGLNAATGKWSWIPTAIYADDPDDKGYYVIPVTPMTAQREEGTRTHTNDSCFVVSYEVNDVGAKTGYVLIDLSNATNYPHTATTEIHVDWVQFSMLGNTTAEGHVKVGFITSIGAEYATVRCFMCKPANKLARTEFVSRQYNPSAVRCTPAAVLAGGGMNLTTETTFQNDVALAGTYEAVIPAVGDLVMLIDWVAGTFETVSIVIGYHTI